jgi:hypothetical protein
LTTVPVQSVTPDHFSTNEARALAPYFTNTDRPVFALINLPETVKGALFARYSRSAKSLRRLFLDEFLGQVPIDPGDRGAAPASAANARTSCTRAYSTNSATTPWRSSEARTSPVRACRTY